MSSNPHPHKATILSLYVPKPLSQTIATDVINRYLEPVPAVEDFERIVPYGARDSSERWRETKVIHRALRARWTCSHVKESAVRRGQIHPYGFGLDDGEIEDYKLELWG